MKKVLQLLTIFCVLFADDLRAENPIIFGILEDTAPNSYIENGQYKGVDYHVYLYLKERLGVKTGLSWGPFKRLLNYLKEGKIDGILTIYHNKRRESFVIYSKTPLRSSAHYIFIKRENRDQFNGYNVKALNGKSVGINRGYYVNEEFLDAAKEKKFILSEANTIEASIQMVYRGRTDCYVGSYDFAMSAIKRLDLQKKIINLEKPIIPSKSVYMAISRKAPNIKDKDAFINKLSALLEEMHEKGIYRKIIDEHFK